MSQSKTFKKEPRKPNLANLVYGKVPPQASDIEEAVIGAIMLEKETFEQVMEVIPSPDCFYMDAHQKIYAACVRLYSRGADVDLLTITDELRKSEELELIGGAYYLTNLTMAVVSSAHVVTHARIVMEKFLLRDLIRISGSVIGDAYEDSTDVFELLERVDRDMYALSGGITKKDFSKSDKVVRKVMQQDEELLAMPDGLVGVPTGNNELDELTGGWKSGKLIVVAARPSVGKTAWALNSAHNAAVIHGMPTGFFSLEMENDELMRRLVSIDSKVNTYRVDYPKTRSAEESIKITDSYQRIAKAPIFFDDTPALSCIELRAKARRMKNKHAIRLIFIDYLQLMKGDSEKSWNREAEIAKISRDLKALAKELQIPIIALCQLNRDIEKRGSNDFRLSDLRESGAIEQDADLIGFLWRPSEEDLKKEPELEGIGKLDIAKHRGGRKKKVLYFADMSTQTWTNHEPKFKSMVPDKPYAGMQGNFKPVEKQPEVIDDLPF